MAGTRIKRGWALAKRSYRVLAQHRSLMLFPVISLAVSVVTAVVFLGPGVIFYVTEAQEPVLVIFGVITLYLLMLVTLFFNTALAAAASKALAGGEPTLAEGFDLARDRLGPIAQWALVQTTVGIAIIALESLLQDSIVGRLLAGFANLAWSVATFFVVPLIALEGNGPRQVFKRSAKLLRERWGEGVVGSASVSAPIALAALPLLLVFGGGGWLLADSSPLLAGVLFALAGLVFIVAMVVGGTLGTIFRVALYEYATTGQAPGEFASADLGSAFKPKSRTKRRARTAPTASA